MTSGELQGWQAQRPPIDFADRTVQAILAAEPPAEAVTPSRRRPRKRWPTLLAVAAVFFGAGAWAAMGGWNPRPPVPEIEPSLPAPPPEPTGAVEPVVPARTVAAEPEPEDAGAPSVRPAPRPSVAATAEPAEPPADAGRWIIVPSCTCSPFEGICSCVE